MRITDDYNTNLNKYNARIFALFLHPTNYLHYTFENNETGIIEKTISTSANFLETNTWFFS